MSDEEAVRRVLAAHGRSADSVRLLGAGLDHAAYEVDGEIVVRLVGDDDGEQVVREARLLRAVAAVVPVPVPVPLLVDPDHGCLAYRKLPGRPLLQVPDATSDAARLGSELGELLAVLHRQPVDRFTDLVDVDCPPLSAWLDEARDLYPSALPAVPRHHRAAVEAFLADDPPADDGARVLAHNDLGVEHVLVDPEGRQIAGVIDWSDAAITDPARDFGLIYRDLGPLALDAALTAYGGDGHAGIRDRARFYARCGALEDLAFGQRTGRGAYVTKSVRSLEWLSQGRVWFGSPPDLDHTR